MMIVFKALQKTGYGAIAKKSVRKIGVLKWRHFEPEVKWTFCLKRLNFNNLDKKCQQMPEAVVFSYKKNIISTQIVYKK